MCIEPKNSQDLTALTDYATVITILNKNLQDYALTKSYAFNDGIKHVLLFLIEYGSKQNSEQLVGLLVLRKIFAVVACNSTCTTTDGYSLQPHFVIDALKCNRNYSG